MPIDMAKRQRAVAQSELKKDKYLRSIWDDIKNPDFRVALARSSADEAAKQAQTNKSRYKVTVSGHIVEVWQFGEGVQHGPKASIDREKHFDPETGEIISDYDPIAKKRQNARQARCEVRRLVVSNFESKSAKFITLTFRDGAVGDVTNIRECNNAFKKFIQRMRRRFDDFKYIKVVEFQDANGRGAVHFHMMADLPYVKYEELAEIWGNGFIGINRIEHVDNLGAYLTKYMLKNFDDPRLRGEKAYSTSKGNLIRPITVYGPDAAELIDAYMLKQKKVVFTNSYESEYYGEIVYREYNLQRGDCK